MTSIGYSWSSHSCHNQSWAGLSHFEGILFVLVQSRLGYDYKHGHRNASKEIPGTYQEFVRNQTWSIEVQAIRKMIYLLFCSLHKKSDKTLNNNEIYSINYWWEHIDPYWDHWTTGGEELLLLCISCIHRIQTCAIQLYTNVQHTVNKSIPRSSTSFNVFFSDRLGQLGKMLE